MRVGREQSDKGRGGRLRKKAKDKRVRGWKQSSKKKKKKRQDETKCRPT